MIVSNGIQIPNGLALDESGSDKKLYWAGKDFNGYGIIEAVSLDGLTRNVIFRRSGYHPFSLGVFQDFVYWSDWEKNAVMRINKTYGEVVEVIVSGVNKSMGLKILHQRKEIHGKKTYELQTEFYSFPLRQYHSFVSHPQSRALRWKAIDISN